MSHRQARSPGVRVRPMAAHTTSGPVPDRVVGVVPGSVAPVDRGKETGRVDAHVDGHAPDERLAHGQCEQERRNHDARSGGVPNGRSVILFLV